MNKEEVLKEVIVVLEKQLEVTFQSAQDAHAGATGDEVRQENKYDTRGLESSYLAGAQAERVRDLGRAIDTLKNIQLKTSKTIGPHSLIELQNEKEESRYFFVLPEGGGTIATFEGKKVSVLTTKAPFYQSISGLEEGEEVQINKSSDKGYWEIVAVC